MTLASGEAGGALGLGGGLGLQFLLHKLTAV